MSKLLLLLMVALGLPGTALAQTRTVRAPNLPADSLTHRIKFTGVVAVPGVSAAELQARAREWVALTFQDAHQVMQLDDATRGVLIGRGFTVMWTDLTLIETGGTPRPLAFTFRLDFREGRYRYEVYDLGLAFVPGFTLYNTAENSASETSQQTNAIAYWQSGGLATVAASTRQHLLQPRYTPDPRDYDLAKSYGHNWPKRSAEISGTVTQLLLSLQQHATAPALKW
jgi:hypothetical protein